MTHFKRLLVALDLTDMDAHLLRYLQYVKNVFSPEEIVLCHVVPHSLYASQYFDQPVTAAAEEALRERVLKENRQLAGDDRVKVIVSEGNPFRTIIDWSSQHRVDLIVVGLKRTSQGSGVLPRKLVRQAPCPVLFVPEIEKPSLTHVWVPVDFSSPSVAALKYADYLRHKVNGLRITGHHVVYLPTAVMLKLTLTQEQEARLITDGTQAFEEFVATNDLSGIQMERLVTRGSHDNPADNILDQAVDHEADLIVITPEGHSAIDLLFLGSVAEKLLSLNQAIPTLILKT
jgi:nucleotide-binding universal stress UspA family protein